MEFFLVSNSHQRANILSSFIPNLKIIKPKVREIKSDITPQTLVLKNSMLKLNYAISKLKQKQNKENKSYVLISADTVLFCCDKIFHKPSSLSNAKKMLRIFSNNKAMIFTGLVVSNLKTKKILKAVCKSTITFLDFNEFTINQYVKKTGKKILNFAGAFSFEHASWLVKNVSGSISNIHGIPINKTLKLLDRLKR